MRTIPGFDSRVVRPVFFVEVDAPSGFLRVNSADRDITLEGNVYKGVGNLGKIGDYAMTQGAQPTSLRLSLTGIDPVLTQNLSDENMRNRDVRVWMALLAPTNLIATDPFLWFKGKTDTGALGVGRFVTYSLTASSRLVHWARSVNSRYTHEDQRAKYPGDDGFKFVATLGQAKLLWGQ